MGDFFISVSGLAKLLDGRNPPLVLDVRKPEAYAESGWLIPTARWRDPASVASWTEQIPPGTAIVVYCVHGHEVSQGAGLALRERGIDARVLNGGFAEWVRAGGAVMPATGLNEGAMQ